MAFPRLPPLQNKGGQRHGDKKSPIHFRMAPANKLCKRFLFWTLLAEFTMGSIFNLLQRCKWHFSVPCFRAI